MRKVRRTFGFGDDCMGARYTFAEVSSALATLAPGRSLSDACRAARRLTQPEVAPRLAKNVRCPVCQLTLPEASVRHLTLSTGRSVTLYPHGSNTGQGVGRVCRVEN